MRPLAIFIAILFASVFFVINPVLADEPEFRDATITVGNGTYKVQVADTPAALERGLMYRASIEPYEGMLFVFQAPQRVTFWMKDTTIPLEIAYFNQQGKLLEIRGLIPMDRTPVPSMSEQIMYALEVPAGGFAKKRVKLGDMLTYPREK